MYNMRRTWIHVFPNSRLYFLDCKIRKIDCNWPKFSDVLVYEDNRSSSSNVNLALGSNMKANCDILKVKHFNNSNFKCLMFIKKILVLL